MSNLQTASDDFNITTWNGAASYSTVNNPLVHLCFKSVRNIPCNDYSSIKVNKDKCQLCSCYLSSCVNKNSIEEYFDKAWSVDPLRTLKFVFYLRDCRQGKGERKLFRALVRHMRESKLETHLIKNLKYIPEYGSWKDISLCFFGTNLESHAVKLIANQLKSDLESDNPSLCAKYAPSEKGAIDKRHKAASKIAAELGVTLTQYRKKYLAPLRAKLNIVERQLCSKKWDDVDYEKVPSIAGTRYKKTFIKHDEIRYKEYLSSVMDGKKKMNTGVLMPHQIVGKYINDSNYVLNKDLTVEAQWVSFIKDRKEKWSEGVDIMPLIDVSGSMYETHDTIRPIDVAVSLGLLFAKLNSSEQYKNKFITFSQTPELVSIKDDSLYEQVTQLSKAGWGMSTNFQAVFDLLLNIAKTFDIPQDKLPKLLLVLSDMQFNEATRKYYSKDKTNWEEINNKYKEAGYERPTILFWNLSGKSVDFPIPDAKVSKCALLSGYNDNILYSILDGKIPNPLEIVKMQLDNDRYSVISLHEE